MAGKLGPIICIGETLIDFVSVESGVSLRQAGQFKKAAGGAPANVAAGLAKLGAKSAFIGKVGRDEFGFFLESTLQEYGVDTSRMIFDPGVRTTLAFVSVKADGERDFMFYRHPGADMMLSPEEIDEDYIAGGSILHHGTISLITQPSRDATLKAIECARSAGLLISFDPNLRLSLWDNPEHAYNEILMRFKTADILKLSEEELEFIAPDKGEEATAREIMNYGVKLLVVTAGKNGCRYYHRAGSGHVPGFTVNVVDTTGAGDGFVAGMLAGLVRIFEDQRKSLDEITNHELTEIMRLANAVGAITCTERGAIHALPTKAEVEKFLSSF
ncbi:MAG TPA: hypothetical protein GXX51_07985 [Firmicutes bacterium]|nr:hypothetical protein [Bacillota bacterium]